MAEVQERRKKTVEASMTEQVHLIMQQHLNGGGRLFGGALMQWLDEVAGVVAMRHAETYRVVTAAVDNLQFKHAIYEGEIIHGSRDRYVCGAAGWYAPYCKPGILCNGSCR